MNVLEIVLPVLVMIVVGMLCRKWKILTRDGINNMKVLVTNVMLPVAIFHALATAEYNKETGILILIMFVMLVVSFGLGFFLKPFLKGTYQKYLPFMVSVYEGGLMAYPFSTCPSIPIYTLNPNNSPAISRTAIRERFSLPQRLVYNG